MVLLLKIGRCYEAKICVILLLFRYAFARCHFFVEVTFFSFWPKTMDYSKGFSFRTHNSSLKGAIIILWGLRYVHTTNGGIVRISVPHTSGLLFVLLS